MRKSTYLLPLICILLIGLVPAVNAVDPWAGYVPDSIKGDYSVSVTFTDISYNYPTSWNWSFRNVTGNNTEIWWSTEQNPVKIFRTGNYSIRLNASTDEGYNITPALVFVNVSRGFYPTPMFSPNVTSGNNPTAVLFTDLSQTDILTWDWSYRNWTAFGEGNSTWTLFSNDQNPTHVFGAGTWEINLSVTNTSGYNSTTSNSWMYFINVGSTNPVAQFSKNVTSGEYLSGTTTIPVQFTDTSYTDILTWNWAFKNTTPGNNTQIWFSTDQNVIKSFGLGNWEITLGVSNASGSNVTIQHLDFTSMETLGENLTTGQELVYNAHLVRFRSVDYTGNPLNNLYVKVDVVESSSPYSWITDIFSININETPVQNTTMDGYTGDDGAINFPMIETLKYRINFIDPSSDLNETMYLYPKEDSYEYVFWTDAPTSPITNIGITFWNATNGTTPTNMDLGVHYQDSLSTTTSLGFTVTDKDGNTLFTKTSTTPNDWNTSYPVPMTEGTSYVWTITGISSDYPNPIKQSKIIQFAYDGGSAIPFDVGADWRQWIAIGIIFLVGSAFGGRGIKVLAFIIPGLAVFFVIIGWLNISFLLLAAVIFFIMVFYIRYAEGEND